MRLNQTNAAAYLPLIQALAAGKTIQMKQSHTFGTPRLYTWVDVEVIGANLPAEDYRIKPEPGYRPWTAKEVPIGAYIRGKGQDECCTTIQAIYYGVIVIPLRESLGNLTVDEALDLWEYTWDRSEGEWKPCGVEL